MTFLDTSALAAYNAGIDDVVEHVDAATGPVRTSAVCLYEYLDGRLAAGVDRFDARQELADVEILALNETLAGFAAGLQQELMAEGERMATTDLLVAATARSTGEELVVADADFDTAVLAERMPVTNFSDTVAESG